MNLSFRLGSIPVRIHPSFLVMTAIIGFGPKERPEQLLEWLVIVFVSVMLHELGHALAGLSFGLSPHIDLHGLGGTTSWSNARGPSPALSPAKRIVISLAGPGTGFVVGGLVLAFAFFSSPESALGRVLDPFILRNLLWVNVVWGILNLLPMLPLDGGNVLVQVFALFKQGERPARVVSLVVAVAAAGGALYLHSLWSAVLVLSFIASNWRGLQALREQEHDAPMLVELEQAYQALDANDAARVLALARPVALQAKTARARAEALQLVAFGFLLEGRVADADAAIAALPRGFSPHPRLAELRAKARPPAA